jgi:hypothetical protein
MTFAAVLSWLLSLVALVPAWCAWRRTRYLGTKLPKWNRLAQRSAFTGLVFLGSFSIMAYAFWKLGAPLQIGVIGSGKMTDVIWLPPVIILWAAVTYLVLLTKTRKGEVHEEPP